MNENILNDILINDIIKIKQNKWKYATREAP